MEAVGIIAEYNPFHNGHLHHLREAKKQSGAEAAVCVMSGNFTQRGEAALLDKWQRAELAVRCGLDLVIELPLVFALRSAQDFARGGVRLLSQLPAVKSLAFGTEHADLQLLHKISAAAQATSTQLLLQENLKLGQPYAAALAHAIERQCGVSENILREPNTILSVEYLNAIKIFQSPLSPLPIERLISHYADSKSPRHWPVPKRSAMKWLPSCPIVPCWQVPCRRRSMKRYAILSGRLRPNIWRQLCWQNSGK